MLSSFECPNCLVGRCQLTHYTFVTRYGDKLLCAPNTEIFICDMCGYQELPYRVLSLYEQFLKPSDDAPSLSVISPPTHKKMSFKKSSQV